MKLKNTDWFVILIAFFIPWILDYSLKKLALVYFEQLHSYGPIHFKVVFNKGVILGLFQNMPHFLLQVCLTTLGFFLLFIYISLQSFLHIHSFNLRLGLSFLGSGIIGNVTDRLLYETIVDFVWIDFRLFKTGIFNLADLMQWIGCFFIIIGIAKYYKIFWPSKESRSYQWVNSSFQIRYMMTSLFFSTSFAVISGVFFYTYFQVMLEKHLQNDLGFSIFSPFFIAYTIITFQFCLTLWFISRILSHRMAGPLYAFEKFIDKLEENENTEDFKIRKTDEFFHLESIAKKIKKMLQNKKSSS